MVKQMSREELLSFLRGMAGTDAAWYADTWHLINKWLVRGDGVAIYSNAFFGADPYDVQMLSYGSAAAQLETVFAPTQMPDIGNRIGWRYQLTHTYRGALLNPWEPLS